MLNQWKPLISPEEIERVKKLRDAGVLPVSGVKKEPEKKGPSQAQGADHDVRLTRERLNGKEQAGLYSLGGANELLAVNVPDGLERRMRKLGLWWRYEGLRKQLQGIQRMIQDSAEKEQIRTINIRCRHISVYVGMDRVGDPEAAYVRIPDLNTVIRSVLSDTCGLCVKNAAEAGKCELRAAMRAMTTISEREVSPARNGCIYKSMTLAEEWELDGGE